MATFNPSFRLNPAQQRAQKLLAGTATHVMLRGGARSGKTFIICRALAVRAMRVQSTHAILRFRFNHLKASVIFDTFPKVMSLCFPGVPYHINQSDWFAAIPAPGDADSRIYFGGLDDKKRTEKILGQEHASLFFNECSQISYDARNQAITRLAQQREGLTLRAYYDCNPPTQGHWTYRLFEKKMEPKSGMPLLNPDKYATMMLNPQDNRMNLAENYIEELESLPEAEKLRFLYGQYASGVSGALWTMDVLDKTRVRPFGEGEAGERARQEFLSQMRTVVVAVDPSGCSGPEDTRSDEVGIAVAARNHAGQGFLIEDLSGRYSPDGWGRAACTAFHRWQADRIVGERNFGGAMVESTIRTVDPDVPITLVTASRGKTQRAEPVAALYEQGRVSHVGAFPDLEEQMCNFSRAGYQGMKSPDRADAAVWALTDLMVGQPAASLHFASL